MYLLIVVIVWIIFAKIFVDWERWKDYYPTVQFYIVCNMAYNFLFFNHTLWEYKAVTVKWLNHTIIDMVFSFFIIPVVIMIYLRYFPKGKKKYITYVTVWIAFFSIIEFLFYKRGLFVYGNGWGPLWSTFFNTIMFVMLRIHYKKPLIAILLSIPIITILLLFFHPFHHELK